MRLLTLAATVLALLPGAALAQGLGDAASRERQKRAEEARRGQKRDEPKRVFTNDDLQTEQPAGAEAAKEGEPGPGADAAKPAVEAAAGAKGDANDPLERERRERQRLEAEWRVRFASARERLAAAEENSWQEVVRTEFYQGIPVQTKVKEKVETPELVAARKAMADLEEEFRRTGLPPGWARER
jgi:hypothetical protein